jgi:DNA replication and repair protein RecF
MNAARIRCLKLTNFRSYHAAQLDVGTGSVVLTGPNGAGKTNLIEAISFLAPGRGLRRATLDEVAFAEGDGSWAVSAEVEGALGLATLGTGIEPPAAEATTRTRLCRIDREPVGSAAAFADHLRVIWLVPAMDQLFAGPASERRRFLDRLVLAVDAGHQGRVNALERALRSRNRLLEDPRPDPHWLDAIEHETAELAVAVAAQRAETVHRLQAALANRKDDAFPSAEIALDGWMERLLPDHPAVEIEERYRGILKNNRARDAAAGRALTRRTRQRGQVEHVPADPAALPFRDARFTHAWLVETLPRLRDAHAALAELFRVIRPGGHVAIQDLVPGRVARAPELRGWRFATADVRREALLHAGFADVVVRDPDESGEHLLACVRSVPKS